MSVDEIHSPFCFGETIDYMVHVIRCSPHPPSLPKEISNMSYHKFLNFSFFRRVENYDKQGLMTSLILDTYSFKKVLFTFEYDTEERLVQWNCSMFDKIVHSRKFVYYEDGSLQRRVRDLCGDTEEWEYDKNGKPLQYIRNWEGNIKTINCLPRTIFKISTNIFLYFITFLIIQCTRKDIFIIFIINVEL